MKINFKLPNDKKTHLFCPKCHLENIQVITKNKRMSFLCKECGNKTPRIICINSNVVWWIDKKRKLTYAVRYFIRKYGNKLIS